jgi:hypothetical protein
MGETCCVTSSSAPGSTIAYDSTLICNRGCCGWCRFAVMTRGCSNLRYRRIEAEIVAGDNAVKAASMASTHAGTDVHTHTASQITDFTAAVTAVVPLAAAAIQPRDHVGADLY